MIAIDRVTSRRAQGGKRMSMNPSITIWPASVAVTVEFSPQHNNAMPNSVGAQAEPSSGAISLCTSPSSETSVCPVLLKVAAARIRIDALISSANISATVESTVASVMASRLSSTDSPNRRVCTTPEWRNRLCGITVAPMIPIAR